MGIADKFSLKGKVAVITGGKGLYGRQIVLAAAQAGAKVYVASRSLDELEEPAAEHRADGLDVTAMRLDLGDEGSILHLKDEIIAREGKVDILVNNAVLRTMKSWDDDAAAFDESMRVNATGLFIITRAFGDEMKKTRSGSIINIGSIQGMVGADGTLYEGLSWTGYLPDYFFHKGGMLNFTRFTASYYGKYNIRCNCVSPGGLKIESTSAEFAQRYSDRTFLGRMAGQEDLMGTIVFLASDASLYVTGANIPVDGGYTAK
jgi:NAD(P)-dependent dehydrogenase (short-subunit alcohol dehydrogenase family)